jgi:hypothetical protein
MEGSIDKNNKMKMVEINQIERQRKKSMIEWSGCIY